MKVQHGPGYVLFEPGTAEIDLDLVQTLKDFIDNGIHRTPASAERFVVFDFSHAKEIQQPALYELVRGLMKGSGTGFRAAIIGGIEVEQAIHDANLSQILCCYRTLDELTNPAAPSRSPVRLDELPGLLAEATCSAISGYTGLELMSEKPRETNAADLRQFYLGSLSRVQADGWKTQVGLLFPLSVYLNIFSRLAGDDYKELTPTIEDGAAEFLNTSLGQARILLNQRLQRDILYSLPRVLKPQHAAQEIRSWLGTSLAIGFLCESGRFTLLINYSIQQDEGVSHGSE